MLRPKPSPQSPPMFASRFVDSFSRTHHMIVAYLFVPAILAVLAMGVWRAGVTPWGALGLIAAGVVAWTLVEYWLHRLLFHWEPKTRWGPRMHFLLHGVHHSWPKDPYRLVLPPTVSIPLAIAFGLLFYWILGQRFWFFHAGFLFGYMVYDLTHYYIHHGKIRSRWMRRIQAHHMSHHFNKRYKDRRFGVSTPIWDRVFRTD